MDNIKDDEEIQNPKNTNYTEEIEEANVLDEIDDEDYSDVIQLTEYCDTSLSTQHKDSFIVAEYEDIETHKLVKKHNLVAKNFVGKITKFVLDFNDVELTTAHKNYIKSVGNLQVQHLEDLLLLVDVNKTMITNIVTRVNATQLEDFVLINSYNSLVNQHLKLIKELTTTYKAIPSTLKKMRADVLCDQQLIESKEGEEIITENYGESQFNNSKQMLKAILEKRKTKGKNNEPIEPEVL